MMYLCIYVLQEASERIEKFNSYFSKLTFIWEKYVSSFQNQLTYWRTYVYETDISYIKTYKLTDWQAYVKSPQTMRAYCTNPI